MRKRIPTLVLRVNIIFSAIAGVLFCVFWLPSFGPGLAEAFPAFALWRYPVLIGFYAAALCFFAALFYFWLFLNGVDRDGIFSVKNLKSIRYCSTAFGVLYFIFAMPVFVLLAELDDAPGLVLIGALFDTIPIGAAALASLIERIAEQKITVI